MTDRHVTDIQVAIKQLEALAARVTELKRRDTEQVGPDGYGAGQADGDARRSVGDHSDPTYNAANARKQHDLVHEHTAALFAALKQACDSISHAAGRLRAIDRHVDERTGVDLFERCPVCDDPMLQPRAGMDDKCYRRWDRAGRPERAPWMHAERKRLTQPEQDVA